MSRLLELFYPPRCACCEELLDWQTMERQTVFCPTCLALWESEKAETCGICAKRISECTCMTMEMEKAKCQAFCKLVYYLHGSNTPVQNRIIYRIKNTREKRPLRFLAKELSPVVQALMHRETISPQNAVLTYIPRSGKARSQHGTDQARALTKCLAEEMNLPWSPLLRRSYWKGKQQKQLSFKQRMQNARKAYRLSPKGECRGKDVLLLDDIVTTGAGMSVCTRLLRRAGAERVFCIAVASSDANRDLHV